MRVYLEQEPVDYFALFPQVLALAAAYALAFPIGWDREQERAALV